MGEHNWFNTKDKLPKQDELVLFILGGYVNTGTYDHYIDSWQCLFGYSDKVVYWIYIPKLPKYIKLHIDL